MATSLLEIENVYQKQIMQDIESDLNDYLDTNQILSQMNTAFGGSATSTNTAVTSSYTTSNSLSSTTKTKKSSTNKASLEPILEEQTVGGQLVPYAASSEKVAEMRQKKNEMLKNKVKMLTQGGSSANLSSLDIKSSSEKEKDGETFITGVKPKDAPTTAIANIH